MENQEVVIVEEVPVTVRVEEAIDNAIVTLGRQLAFVGIAVVALGVTNAVLARYNNRYEDDASVEDPEA